MDAQRFSKTMGGTAEKPQSHWGKGAPRVRTKAFWKDAMKWNREAGERLQATMRFAQNVPGRVTLERPRIFPSLCDWLDDEVPIEWLADFLRLIHDTPHLDWLLLTKRPEKWQRRLLEARECLDRKCDPIFRIAAHCVNCWLHHNDPPSNVWLGVSVEDQPRADERIPALLKMPARVRFLSVEPLLGSVDVSEFVFESGCKPHCGNKCSKDADCPIEGRKGTWLIVGGESGRGARPCRVDWIRDIVRQCKAADVAVFCKQGGSNLVDEDGKRIPTNDRKGGDLNELPEDIRIRQFPV